MDVLRPSIAHTAQLLEIGLRSVRNGWAQNIEARVSALNHAIRENGWDSDEALAFGWLHEYYTAEPTNKKQERSA